MTGRRRLERLRRAVMRVGCLGAILAAAAAPASAKTTTVPRLDPNFGEGGKAMVAFPAENAGDVGIKYEIPFQFTAGHLEMAPAPGGRLVVAGSSKVTELLANGRPNRGFGGDGSVAIAPPPGMRFVLADAAVDSQGRVLVAGSVRPQPADATPDPLASRAMVVRFAADGSIDPSFGWEGTLITDFGFQAPDIRSLRYPSAAVGLRSLVVDAQDRPVLTGAYVSEIAYCRGNEDAISRGFVARLTGAGTQDPSFGDAGLREIAGISSFEQVSLFPSGSLLTIGSKPLCDNGDGPRVLLTSFNSDGNLEPPFGFAGFRSVGYESAPVATVATSGKIALLGSKRKSSQLVMRLLPDGAVDPGFGRTGRVQLVSPKGTSFASLALDRRGNLLLAGRSARRVSKSRKNRLRRSTFLLARMTENGNVDRSFGRRGSIRTGFGGPSSSFATQIMLDRRGRILVGGGVSTPKLRTGGGYAIARYLGGR
jgi:uncharacterized delta-60 repeat protein